MRRSICFFIISCILSMSSISSTASPTEREEEYNSLYKKKSHYCQLFSSTLILNENISTAMSSHPEIIVNIYSEEETPTCLQEIFLVNLYEQKIIPTTISTLLKMSPRIEQYGYWHKVSIQPKEKLIPGYTYQVTYNDKVYLVFTEKPPYNSQISGKYQQELTQIKIQNSLNLYMSISAEVEPN